MSHVLMIDNYDSFTYNLVQSLLIIGVEVTVRTNDLISLDEALNLEPTHLIVSPGPGRPEDAGVSMAMIREFSERIPVLGVCLGHQALAAVFGSPVVAAQTLMHGKASLVHHDGLTVFSGIPSPFTAGRYHSLAVSETGLGPDLTISAHTADGEIMGVRHRTLPLEGVQFHPESILTPHGAQLLQNFIALVPSARSEQDGVVTA